MKTLNFGRIADDLRPTPFSLLWRWGLTILMNRRQLLRHLQGLDQMLEANSLG